MAPRAYWKGYLKLSLVSCPIALFPAASEREKISFHQLNKKTGNRIKYRKVDAETGHEVDQENIIKGYEVSKGEYIELGPEELEAVAIDSKRTEAPPGKRSMFGYLTIDLLNSVSGMSISERFQPQPYTCKWLVAFIASPLTSGLLGQE